MAPKTVIVQAPRDIERLFAELRKEGIATGRSAIQVAVERLEDPREIQTLYDAHLRGARRESLNEEIAKALAKQPVEKQNLWTNAVLFSGLTYAVFKHTVPQGHVLRQAGPTGYALYLSWPQNPNSLDDVTIRTDYQLPIEKPVENLLKAINFLGIATRCSGDGVTSLSYGWQFGGRPWVEIEFESKSLATMQAIVGAFNDKSEIKWSCDGSYGGHGFVVIPSSGDPWVLNALHKSCDELAQFIFERAKAAETAKESLRNRGQ